jgi:hypothetical protein
MQSLDLILQETANRPRYLCPRQVLGVFGVVGREMVRTGIAPYC